MIRYDIHRSRMLHCMENHVKYTQTSPLLNRTLPSLYACNYRISLCRVRPYKHLHHPSVTLNPIPIDFRSSPKVPLLVERVTRPLQCVHKHILVPSQQNMFDEIRGNIKPYQRKDATIVNSENKLKALYFVSYFIRTLILDFQLFVSISALIITL